ncbi:MAG TPA: endolytic transglycosylase MltG [Candidatus Limnocylindrales bacterium]|nr:endolytic transglycosylase MltG [Candidatus Limnocylindrales bacterium]
MSIRGGRSPRDDYNVPATGVGGKRQNGYQRTGRYGHGPGDQRRYDRYGPRGGLRSLAGFVIFMLVLAVLVLLALFTIARPIARLAIVPLAENNPGALRIGFVADLVREDLGGALTAPASSDSTEVEFTVEAGDTPVTLAPRLMEAGVIASERAFLFEARMDGLGDKLSAGRYALAMNLTPAEVVGGLVDNRILIRTADITFREGLRLEQITAKLANTPDIGVDPAQFLELARKPTDAILADYLWLLDENVRPKGASLEGFLYPATYSLRVDSGDPTTAEDLVRMMLDAFYESVGQARLDVPEKRGLTFYQVLTLASIVEREAVLDDERPLIAGVYQNRIDRVPSVKHGLLQADPTIIYAVDTVNLGTYSPDWVKYKFWTVPKDGSLKDQVLPEALAGFNTYVVRGLPPAPIATPSIQSLDAALTPDTKSGYTYFVAIPEGKGAHDFSKSAAEHEKKLRKYGY